MSLALGSMGEAANAVGWYSNTSPLTAYDGGYARAKAYGNFYNDNGTYARNNSQRKDALPGGNGVFVDTTFSWYMNTTCGASTCTDFDHDTNQQTTRTTSSTWVSGYSIQNLRSDAWVARASIRVCEDRSWAPDACSASTTRSFNY